MGEKVKSCLSFSSLYKMRKREEILSHKEMNGTKKQ
jgi:hypothetical protein